MSFPAYPKMKPSGQVHLGEIPSVWGIAQLRHLARLVYGDALASEQRNPNGKTQVFGSNGPIGLHDAANTKRPVIFIGRKGSLGAINWSEEGGFAIDTVYFVDERSAHCDLRWLYWTLHVLGLEKTSQDTGVPGLSREVAHSAQVPVASRSEQSRIAAYLDCETSKIDALVETQRELIALLKEKRQAVISHAVTKGLDPAVPMKPSGIDWLGDIPEHWEATRLKSVCSEIVDCKNRTPPEVPEGGYFVIRTSCLGNGEFDPNGGYWTDEASFVEWTRKGTPRHGDILISREAPIGEACLFPDGYPLCLGQRMMFLRPALSQADPSFLLSAIYSSYGRRYVDLRRKGSTVGHLRVSEIDNYPFIMPPIEEQKKIASYLTYGTTQIDKLIAEAHSAISLIRERRTALISAAVTGKIDVRGLVDLPETEKVSA